MVSIGTKWCQRTGYKIGIVRSLSFAAFLGSLLRPTSKSSFVIYFLFGILFCWHMDPKGLVVYDDYIGIRDLFWSINIRWQISMISYGFILLSKVRKKNCILYSWMHLHDSFLIIIICFCHSKCSISIVLLIICKENGYRQWVSSLGIHVFDNHPTVCYPSWYCNGTESKIYYRCMDYDVGIP